MAAERAASGGKRVGQRIGDRYAFLRVLGSGGMGEVYEAEDRLLGRSVAVKTLWPDLSRDAEQVARFQREARAASVVASAHVVDVLETGLLADGAPFLVMELLAGETLAAALARTPAFPVARAASIARQIASGLAAAHGAGIVHRDLKPENVFLVPRAAGRELVKILDFGVSKFRSLDLDDGLTRTGTAIGTPAYMSPEQSGGARDIDHRTDVWALGVILHRMLTGELPFTAENYARLLLRIVSEASPSVRARRPDVPAALEAIVVRCLEKQPADRFQAMADAAAALTPFERSTARLDLIDGPGPDLAGSGPTRVAEAPEALLQRATPKTAAREADRPEPIGSAPTAIAQVYRGGAPVTPPVAWGTAPRPPEPRPPAPGRRDESRPIGRAEMDLARDAPAPARRDESRPIGRVEMDAARDGEPRREGSRPRAEAEPPREGSRPRAEVEAPASAAESGRRERRDGSRPIGRAEMDRSREGAAPRPDLPVVDPGFRQPRESYPLEVEEVLRSVPPGASVKGLFLQSVLDRAPDRAAIFERAGVPPMRIVAFLDVDYDAYLRLVVAAAESAHPGIPRPLALRRFHHAFYETFADTLAGRVMFGVLGRDAEKVMPLGAEGYKVNVRLGQVRSYALSPRHVRYDFRGYPKAICESCDVGVVEGALRFLGQPRARVLVREDGADAMTIDAAW